MGQMIDEAKYFLLQQDPNNHSKHAVIHSGNFCQLDLTLKEHDILQACGTYLLAILMDQLLYLKYYSTMFLLSEVNDVWYSSSNTRGVQQNMIPNSQQDAGRISHWGCNYSYTMVLLAGQELPTLPDHLSSPHPPPPDFSGSTRSWSLS